MPQLPPISRIPSWSELKVKFGVLSSVGVVTGVTKANSGASVSLNVTPIVLLPPMACSITLASPPANALSVKVKTISLKLSLVSLLIAAPDILKSAREPSALTASDGTKPLGKPAILKCSGEVSVPEGLTKVSSVTKILKLPDTLPVSSTSLKSPTKSNC